MTGAGSAGGRHTPGPWIEDEAGICDRAGLWGVVAQVCLPEFYWGRDEEDDIPRDVLAEHAANARLIAAAPELREALSAISDMLFARPDMMKVLLPLMGPAEHAVFDQCRAAIAKADRP